MTRFFIGTAGWSYLQWEKEFYPLKTKSQNKLSYYALRFNAVELNNSFYHTPTPKQFSAWESQVPKTFQFAVKASRYITHIKRLNDAKHTLPVFFKAIRHQKKAGPLLFQLPPTFSLNLERLTTFLEHLPNNRRYVIELRDPSWHVDAVYKLLKKHKICFCLYDTNESSSPRVLTTDFAYVRLRGRNKRGLDTFLQDWEKWLTVNTKKAYVFFDNREHKNLAFGNAHRFQELVEKKLL